MINEVEILWWLTGASNGPVRVRTRSERVLQIMSTPNLEPDRRSGSPPVLNLEPDHGQVRQGSGSNQGSEPNLTTPKFCSHDDGLLTEGTCGSGSPGDAVD